MSTGAKRKSAFDPSRKWGLKPDPDAAGTGTTYIISGHTISGSNDKRSMFVSETIGREAQAKASRKDSAKDVDRELQKLLKRDKEGMKAVASARSYAKKLAKEAKDESAADKTKKGATKQNGKSKSKVVEKKRIEDAGDDPSDEDDDDEPKKTKSTYSVSLVRQLGFDPSAKDGKRVPNLAIQSKVRRALR